MDIIFQLTPLASWAFMGTMLAAIAVFVNHLTEKDDQ